MFPALLAVALAAPVERTWLDRLDPATLPAAERFAWQPPELVGVLGTHRGRHWGSALAAAVSPDGKLVASGGSDHAVRLWDARDLTPLATLHGHRDSVARVVFSPDGQLLASACDDSTVGGPADLTVRLWRVAGKDSKPWAALPPLPSRAVALAFLDGGRAVGTVSQDGAVRVWDVTGKEPRERAAFAVQPEKAEERAFFLVMSAAFAPDGKTVVVGGGPFAPSVTEWDTTTGQRRANLTVADAARAVPPIQSNDAAARVRMTDGTAEVVRGAGKAERVVARLPGVTVTPGGLSPDGRTLTGVSGARVRVWDVAADGLRERVVDNAPTDFLFAAAFNPAGDRLHAVHSGPTMGEEVFLTWELKGAQPTPASVPREPPRGWAKVVFAPGGALAAVDSRPGGSVFDAATGKVKSVMPGPPKNPYHTMVHALAFGPDGKRMATAVSASRFEGKDIVLDWHAVVWDVTTPRATAVRELPEGGPRVTALAFTADGRALVTGHQDGGLAWWDIAADPPRLVKAWRPHTAAVSAVAASPDGKEVASGTAFGEVRRATVGDAGAVVFTDRTAGGRADQLAFTPDGRHVLAMFNTGRFVAVVGAKVAIDLLPGEHAFAAGARRGFGLAADGRHVAVPTANGLVYLLRLR